MEILYLTVPVGVGSGLQDFQIGNQLTLSSLIIQLSLSTPLCITYPEQNGGLHADSANKEL